MDCVKENSVNRSILYVFNGTKYSTHNRQSEYLAPIKGTKILDPAIVDFEIFLW